MIEPLTLFDLGPPKRQQLVDTVTPAPLDDAMENAPINPARLRAQADCAPHGFRYCFAHDEFEAGVAIYVVGKRHMFLCESAAAAREGVKWAGWGAESITRQRVAKRNGDRI